jgi:hypothetical protein
VTQPPQPIQYASLDAQHATDAGNIRVLSICHYVWGGLVMLLSGIFIIHVALGMMMVGGKLPMTPRAGQPPPPPEMGWVFVGVGGCAIVTGWALGILNLLSGRWMTRRRNRLFSLVMAGINCASFPFGTALGVFTFIVLLRPSVRTSYEMAARP